MTNPDRIALLAEGSLLQKGVRFLAALLDRITGRIANGLGALAPLVLAVGCESAAGPLESPVESPPFVSEVTAVPADAGAPEEEAKPIGNFSITFYYVIGEEEVVSKKKPLALAPAANDNQSAGTATAGTANTTNTIDESDPELAAITAPEKVTLFSKTNGSCEPITEVSREFADQLRIQGTGKLRDGRVLNIWGTCSCSSSPCFKVTAAQWGTAGSGRQLQPFRTVAVDPKVIKLGTLLHVPLLEGRQMPGRPPWGGYVHDGCVVADDVGGGIRGHQLDLFVGRKGWFLGMSGTGGSHAWARHVPVYDGTKICERKGRHVARKAGAI